MDHEERDDIITLFDEEGNEIEFEHLDTFELDSIVYVVLLERMEDADEENDEVVILRLEKDEDGTETLMVIEDDAELDAAFEEFSARVEDQADYEEEDE